ncbi:MULTISPECIES: adenine phosphoribosyltransferase [Aerococcus]|uniref:adenine phosphoribosyltransferase n=1 Tax=Aerococcus urinae (strain CCUG 59500 / ACS-120-V-Col10a) TaxID=2976812 RepID=UPI000200E73C|nr:adenine phosphoribosyltransferase [Aerococcus sp. Group 1]AEA01654.1 adenine phosphoribosyltransferase [Aerococcus sp. Group 1]MCY3030453.1 adenine phosphoribosyltransferase [Aerococcus sp. Group 1]MCY3054495.1 adenine phosphoribosyltransferase [Aerococcus sp. Group 1]MCY3056225.1 adenine phosphoribosyltransferase [Aerococcus sp. Group 1]MCY3061683.1 adenine phosphoribosyltransferase [Aerococcus sp. Group 1]
MNLKDYIKDIPNFPEEGIIFRDITPLLQDPEAFQYTVDKIADFAREKSADVIIGPEARGFIVGCPVAYALNKGFVPARKKNKLPREKVSIEYDLEYGSNTIEIHKDAIQPGQKVLIVDDLLATGGTIRGTKKLVEELGGEVVGAAFIIELENLKGRQLINDLDILALINYD